MPNLELIQKNIQPKVTIEQFKTMLELKDDIERKMREVNVNLEAQRKQLPELELNKIQEGKSLILDHLGRSFSEEENPPTTIIDPKDTPMMQIVDLDGKPFAEKKPEETLIVDQQGKPFDSTKEIPLIIDPKDDPMMQIVDLDGNPISSKDTVKENEEVKTPEIRKITIETAKGAEPEILEEDEEPGEEVATVEEITTPAKTPEQQELEDVVARIRAYNKGETATLSKADLDYRQKNWGAVEVELMNLHKTETPPAQALDPKNVIEYTGANLERSRNDYVLAIFNNRKALYENESWKNPQRGMQETVDPANKVYLENLKKTYHENIAKEIAKIPKPATELLVDQYEYSKAKMEFIAEEQDAFNNELFRLENEETKNRIGRALDKAINGAGVVAEKTGAAVNAVGGAAGWGIDKVGQGVGWGVNKVSERFKSKEAKKKLKEGEGAHWLYLLAIPASPTMAGVWLGNKVADGINSSIDLLKKKFAAATSGEKDPKKKSSLVEKYGKKGEKKGKEKPEDAPEPTEAEVRAQEAKEKKEKEIALRKNEFLEKAFDSDLSGPEFKRWNDKTKKVSIGGFFNPSRLKPPTTIDSYKPGQRAIYDKLIELYKKEPASKTSDKVSIDDFITKLAEKDLLKDLWNKTSSSNS